MELNKHEMLMWIKAKVGFMMEMKHTKNNKVNAGNKTNVQDNMKWNVSAFPSFPISTNL